jgi:HSP20 family molecular chaperone IbpA
MSCLSTPSAEWRHMDSSSRCSNGIRCVSPTTSDVEDDYTTRRPSSNIPTDWKVEQDETSIRLTLEMEGVKGRDISISVHDGILTIEGYYRRGNDGGRGKKQRLQRRFPVDTSVVDVSRAMASMWNNTLVLYAPKGPSRSFTMAEPEFEFSTPEADRMAATTTATTTTSV